VWRGRLLLKLPQHNKRGLYREGFPHWLAGKQRLVGGDGVGALADSQRRAYFASYLLLAVVHNCGRKGEEQFLLEYVLLRSVHKFIDMPQFMWVATRIQELLQDRRTDKHKDLPSAVRPILYIY